MISVPIVIFLDIDGVLLPFPSSSSSSSSVSNNSCNSNNKKKTTLATVLSNNDSSNSNDNNDDNNNDDSAILKDDNKDNDYNNNNNKNDDMIDNSQKMMMSGTFPDCTVASLSMILEMLLTTYNSTWIQTTTATTSVDTSTAKSLSSLYSSSCIYNKLSSLTTTTKVETNEKILRDMKNDNNDIDSTDIDVTAVKNHHINYNSNILNDDLSSDNIYSNNSILPATFSSSSIIDHQELPVVTHQQEEQSMLSICTIDIQIVLSSTWRVYKSSIDEILNNFQLYYTEQQQLHNTDNNKNNTTIHPFQFITKFYDTTNVSIHRERSYEIYDWLERNYPHRTCRNTTGSQSNTNDNNNKNYKKYNRHDNNKRSKCSSNDNHQSLVSNSNKKKNIAWIAIDDENLVKECYNTNYYTEFASRCICTTSSIGLTKNDSQLAIQSIQQQISNLV